MLTSGTPTHVFAMWLKQVIFTFCTLMCMCTYYRCDNYCLFPPVLNVVLQTYPQQDLKDIDNIKELLDGLVSYTGKLYRHTHVVHVDNFSD